MTHEEVEFCAEEALVTIVPAFRKDAPLALLGGRYGPFVPQARVRRLSPAPRHVCRVGALAGRLICTPRRTACTPVGLRRAEGFAAAPSLGIPPAHLTLMLKAMSGVVNDPRGTAFRARIEEPEFAMGGKTGTSQVRRITAQERASGMRKPHEVPWNERDHALFVGYAPVREPRYACAAIVEHGGGGSSIAAPIVRDILLEAQRRDSAGAGRERRASGHGAASG
jgi:hypothetical protein